MYKHMLLLRYFRRLGILTKAFPFVPCPNIISRSQGISYCLTVFIADTTALKSRPLMLAFATSPYIITSWIGGPVAQSVVTRGGPGWRWGFGIFSVVVPVVVSPLIGLFLWNHRKARKAGLISSTPISLSPRSIKNYAIEVDLVGILMLASGMALFLLPFSLYSYQPDQWRSPMIICMIIFGGLLIIAFAFYEKYIAPVTFIPFELLLDRTVFLAGIMFTLVFFNSIVWGSYFFSMLQVVWGLSVINASYVSAIYRVGSCFFAIIVGVAIRWTGRFKWIALYFAIPLMMLGVGLMIHFRQPNSDIGYIIMTQIFVAFSGGTIVLCGEMAMMAPSDHQHIAVIIAILNLFSSIGSALGGTVATSIWTSVFPAALKKYLPPDVDYKMVYGSILWQMFYEKGTPARNAINRAYGDAQRLMLITSVCLLAGALICVAFWRDINVKHIKQVKGRVF
jgi:MFS family permease